MDTGHTGLQRQPFDPRGQPLVFVQYESQQDAHIFLHRVLNSNRGIGVFYGPPLSGKKTIVRQFVRSVPEDLKVAIVDGSHLKAKQLIEAIFAQFGEPARYESGEESWIALAEFLIGKFRHKAPPILVVENIDKMFPSTLCLLCKLAELSANGRFALRMILMNSKPPFSITHAPSMSAIAARTVGTFALGPMTQSESENYLYAKLLAGGCDDPDGLMPVSLRRKLHEQSEGWPGLLDQLAMQAIEEISLAEQQAESLPVRPAATEPPTYKQFETAEPRAAGQPSEVAAPADSAHLAAVQDADDSPNVRKLFLTFNRKTLQEIDLDDTKTLIGRSELCDVAIKSRFVSKHHALLVRTDHTMHLLDLNSTNGTFVNSERVQEKVLRHGDVISIGNHGIKLICPAYRGRPASTEFDLAETATMKTIDDMREAKSAPADIEPPTEKTGTESSD